MHGQIQKSFKGRMGGVPELCISFVTFKISRYYRLNISVCAMSSLAFQGEVRNRNLPLTPLIEQKHV